MRTITLSKQLQTDLFHSCCYFIDNQDRRLSQDYEELRDITKNDSNRFKVTVSLEERIPYCKDIIINILVKHILEIVDCNEDDTEEMNAFYDYVTGVYARPGWFDGDAYLLKATTVEALEYVVRWVITQIGE